MVRDARRRAPHHEGLRPHPEEHREAMRLEVWSEWKTPYSVAGTEWCSCVMSQLPSIFRSPMVSLNRNPPCSAGPLDVSEPHRMMATAKATSSPAVMQALRRRTPAAACDT